MAGCQNKEGDQLPRWDHRFQDEEAPIENTTIQTKRTTDNSQKFYPRNLGLQIIEGEHHEPKSTADSLEKRSLPVASMVFPNEAVPFASTRSITSTKASSIRTNSTKSSAIPLATVVHCDRVDDSKGDNKSRYLRFLCFCLPLVAILLVITIPLVIFTKQARKSLVTENDAANSTVNQSPSTLESCRDEIHLIGSGSGDIINNESETSELQMQQSEPLCFSTLDFSQSSSQPSFDLKVRNCPLRSRDDWIGLFPSQAMTVSRLWAANSWGAFLSCGLNEAVAFLDDEFLKDPPPCLFKDSSGELFFKESVLMEATNFRIYSSMTSLDPGSYRFFLVKGGSSWPYEYKTYSEPFRVVADRRACNIPQDYLYDQSAEYFRSITSGSTPSNNAFNPKQREGITDDDSFFNDDATSDSLADGLVPPMQEEKDAIADDGFFDETSNNEVWNGIIDEGNSNDDGFFDETSNNKIVFDDGGFFEESDENFIWDAGRDRKQDPGRSRRLV